MLWLKQLFTHRRRYAELSESIREHLDEKVADLMGSGMTRQQAKRAARLEFGNAAVLEERSREVWQWAAIESICADGKFALRQFWKSPGFTATAVFTLSLGIAVNATMFSMVSAFLMPRLPGHDSQKIVVLSSVNPNLSFQPDTNPVSALNYLAWRADRRVFTEMAAEEDGRTGSLSARERPEAHGPLLVCRTAGGGFAHSSIVHFWTLLFTYEHRSDGSNLQMIDLMKKSWIY